MEDEMKDSTFTIDQITDLRLIEKARIKSGEPGFRMELQALITRLKTNDTREAQAKLLYLWGFGGNCEFADFLTSIPEIPERLKADNDRFPELVLVDTRLPISKICELLGIELFGDDETYVDFDPTTAKTDEVYWIRAQDGLKNKGKSVRACRESFTEDEVGLSVYEGLALFVQNPKALKGRATDLPGSVHSGQRAYAAFLVWYHGRPKLSWPTDGGGFAGDGPASRLK
jgi:hypothetical protein